MEKEKESTVWDLGYSVPFPGFNVLRTHLLDTFSTFLIFMGLSVSDLPCSLLMAYLWRIYVFGPLF